MIKFLKSDTGVIYEKHKGDFDSSNYQTKLKAAGGYKAYVKSLGGVFAKYTDYSGKVTNIDDYYGILDYVFGLFTIYGFDYDNGKTYVKFQDKPFYVNGAKGKCNAGKIDDLCGNSSKYKTTCCNYAIDALLKKMGWLPNGAQIMCTQASHGQLVLKKEDLKPGDIVHFYKDTNKVFDPYKTSTYSKSFWHHVVIVVAVSDTTVTVADGGSRMQRNGGQWLYDVPIKDKGFGGTYGSTDKWLARRIGSMAVVPEKTGKTADDMAIEVILGHTITGATWGSGDTRKKNLGDLYHDVQEVRVNLFLKDESAFQKALVRHVLEGKAGAGEVRKAYLGDKWQLAQDGINAINAKVKDFYSSIEDEEWRELTKMFIKM